MISPFQPCFMKQIYILFLIQLITSNATSQNLPPSQDLRMYDIIKSVSSEKLESSIQKLASFGTRHTLSDTVSNLRGIGAARRWIKSEFDKISSECNNCLEVKYHRGLVEAGTNARIPDDTWIVNVLAIKKGTHYPDRYIIMSGDIDSRVSDPLDCKSDSPGANDNASGMAGVIEAARVLSKYDFESTIVFAGLSGEEQGLFGGKQLAEDAIKWNWDIVAVLNNDMIGNIEGIDGVIDNSSFRIFSEAIPPNPDERELIWNRFYGGETDGPSRQLARYVSMMTERYIPHLNAKMIYRLDRFGRGGHHKPFNDAGFPGVRIMETHENYNRQHQDIRFENGIHYGDLIEGVNFDYVAKLTSVNAICLAGLAWSPPGPEFVMIGGAVQASTRLKWDPVEDDQLAGYKVYWRETTSPQWEYSHWVGLKTDVTLENIIIDNYLFGVSAVSKTGNESVVVYPKTLIPRR